MADDKQPPPAEGQDLESEIRQARKFTPQEALARMAGPGAMKGASPVSRHKQAEMEVGAWLKGHIPDPTGALQLVLHRFANGSQLLLDEPERPLAALADCIRRLLESDELLKDLVREADVEWGRRMDERPYFEKEGTSAHRDDPYALEAVRRLLDDALKQLRAT